MIKAIIFDFYGVICSDDLWDFVDEDKQGGGRIHDLADQVNLGQIGWGEYCRQLAIASDRRVEEINAMYQTHRINRSLIGYIGELKKEYKIALLTNASHGHVDNVLEELGAANDFDAIVMSADVGMIKPQPGIYRAAIKELGIEADEAVFIDDAAINIEGAEVVGLRAILFENPAQLRRDLTHLLEH